MPALIILPSFNSYFLFSSSISPNPERTFLPDLEHTKIATSPGPSNDTPDFPSIIGVILLDMVELELRKSIIDLILSVYSFIIKVFSSSVSIENTLD